MTDKMQTYRIAGKSYTEEDLKVFAKGKVKNEATPVWEKKIHRFILDWISPMEYIQVETSGSTGLPKTIELQKAHVEASAQATLTFLGLKQGDTAYLCLPVDYIAGKMMVVRSLVGGFDLHYAEPSSTPDLTALDKIDFAGMIPMQVSKLLESDNGKQQLNKIEKLIIGGSFVPASLEDKIKTLPNKIWSTYGMTETITHIALRRLNGENTSEKYTPLPTVNVSLDERGCLVIYADYVDVKGLITNDLAQISSDGSFKVLGRIDNIVMSGGLLLHPEIIEKKLHGFVDRDFFLSGLRDQELGERLVIFIEDPNGDLSTKETELQNAINERLTGYEIPKSIIFMEKFDRTGNGKILRPVTVENYVAQFDTSIDDEEESEPDL